MPQSVTHKGVTTHFWGTDSVGSTISAAICETAEFTPKENVFGRVESNNGFEVSTILGDDGFDVVLTYTYNTAITYPTFGSTITVKLPSDGTGVSCLVTNKPVYEMRATRKGTATIVVKAEYRPDRALA